MSVINREMVLELIENVKNNGGFSDYASYSYLFDQVDTTPEETMESHWIPVTKEEMFKAGYEGREIRFRVDGRLFAIRELAQ